MDFGYDFPGMYLCFLQFGFIAVSEQRAVSGGVVLSSSFSRYVCVFLFDFFFSWLADGLGNGRCWHSIFDWEWAYILRNLVFFPPFFLEIFFHFSPTFLPATVHSETIFRTEVCSMAIQHHFVSNF